MLSIRTVLSSKSDRTNVAVEASATMLDAVKAMNDANIGAVLVTENGNVVAWGQLVFKRPIERYRRANFGVAGGAGEA